MDVTRGPRDGSVCVAIAVRDDDLTAFVGEVNGGPADGMLGLGLTVSRDGRPVVRLVLDRAAVARVIQLGAQFLARDPRADSTDEEPSPDAPEDDP